MREVCLQESKFLCFLFVPTLGCKWLELRVWVSIESCCLVQSCEDGALLQASRGSTALCSSKNSRCQVSLHLCHLRIWKRGIGKRLRVSLSAVLDTCSCTYIYSEKNQNGESCFWVSKNIHNDGVLRQRGKSQEFAALLQNDLRNTQYIIYIILCMKGNDGPFAKKAFVKDSSVYQMLWETLEILRLVAHSLLPLGIYHLVGRSNRVDK